MYIAGRLRTASIPPRTLIEVASYLWPLAAVLSFSPMNGVLLARRQACSVARSSYVREGSRAEELDTCLAHWPRRVHHNASWGSKGFSSSSRPVPAEPVGRSEELWPVAGRIQAERSSRPGANAKFRSNLGLKAVPV